MAIRAGTLSGPSLPLRAILWLFALLTVFPFGLLLLTSLKSQPDLLRGAFTLPDRPHFENFVSAWVDGHFGTYFLNSILVVVPVVAVSVALGFLSGFAFAFLTLPFKRTLFVILTFGGTPSGLGPLAVALLVVGIGVSIGGPTGYAINPARDLGPRIAHAILPIKGKGSSDWAYSWIPVVGPLVGGTLAGLVALWVPAIMPSVAG